MSKPYCDASGRLEQITFDRTLFRVFTQSLDLIFLLGALIAFYISSRFAADALDSTSPPSPGRQAVGYAVPIAAVAFGSAGAGHPQLAVNVIFASAVAATALVAALCILAAPNGPVESRPVWALLLPAALLAWIAGFSGRLSWIVVVALLIEGLAIVAAWTARADTGKSGAFEVPRAPYPILRVLQFILAILLAAIGVWATIHAADYVARHSHFVTQGLFAAAVVAPILVLPMIGAGAAQVQRGQLNVALGAQVGVALLNLCLILPLTGVVWWIAHRHQPLLAIPLGTWRIDSVGLVVLGLMALCLGTRMVRPGKILGGILLLGYAAYLLLSLRAALRV